MFISSNTSSPALGQPSLLFSTYRGLFCRVKADGTWSLLPFIAEFKNEWSYTSSHRICLNGVYRDNFESGLCTCNEFYTRLLVSLNEMLIDVTLTSVVSDVQRKNVLLRRGDLRLHCVLLSGLRLHCVIFSDLILNYVLWPGFRLRVAIFSVLKTRDFISVFWRFLTREMIVKGLESCCRCRLFCIPW
jgi:hypothetical protein